MKDATILLIKNSDQFINQLTNNIGKSVKIAEYEAMIPKPKSEYFGAIESEKFIIYGQQDLIFQKKIVLQAEGLVQGDRLQLKITFYDLRQFIVNNVILTLCGVIMFLAFSRELGIGIGILSLAQIVFFTVNYQEKKKKFLRMIKKII
mgnify:CR=1 FL=1